MENVTTAVSTDKLLPIGQVWVNKGTAERPLKETSPVMDVRIDSNLSFSITITPGTKLLMFKNTNKREGKRDPDYRLAIALPHEIAAKEIARQKAVREAKKAESTPTIDQIEEGDTGPVPTP